MILPTYHELDGISNKLGVLFHNILNAPLLNIFRLILFEMENDFGAAAKWLTMIWPDGKRTS